MVWPAVEGEMVAGWRQDGLAGCRGWDGGWLEARWSGWQKRLK